MKDHLDDETGRELVRLTDWIEVEEYYVEERKDPLCLSEGGDLP